MELLQLEHGKVYCNYQITLTKRYGRKVYKNQYHNVKCEVTSHVSGYPHGEVLPNWINDKLADGWELAYIMPEIKR